MVHAQLYTTYLLLSIIALCAHAAPTRSQSPILSLRQAADDKPFDGPKVVQTHNVTKVTGGNVVEDCTVTFTPIVVDGKNLVRQEKKCTRLFVPDGQSLPAPSAPANTDTTPPATTTTAPPADTTTTAPGDVSTTSADPAATTTTTTTDGADTTTTDAGETTTSTDVPPTTTDASSSTSAPADTTSTDSAPATSDTPTEPSDPAASSSASDSASTSGGVIVLGPSSVPAEQNQGTTGTAAAANEGTPTPSSSDVVIPGKKFEVLPIGLGVFAGISVIALIVVGLVTYERTKYRKAFRQRRLAANGAEMGYGGMSERR
jgi:hypothetical protein